MGTFSDVYYNLTPIDILKFMKIHNEYNYPELKDVNKNVIDNDGKLHTIDELPGWDSL